MVYAAMYITDVLKEWEHPYALDLSWRYALNTFLDKVQAGIESGWTISDAEVGR
jgi:hypothetical protein